MDNGESVVSFCHSKLRYFDWDGQVHLAKGKQGDSVVLIVKGKLDNQIPIFIITVGI